MRQKNFKKIIKNFKIKKSTKKYFLSVLLILLLVMSGVGTGFPKTSQAAAATVKTLGSAFTTTAGNKFVTATPTVGDLIVIITTVTSAGSVVSTVADNGTGGTYTQVSSDRTGFSTGGHLQMWVRNNLVSAASSTVYTTTPTGTSTGGGLVVLRVTGVTATGASAVRSSGGQSTGTSGTTPAPVLNNTPLTQNPIIVAVANASGSTSTLVPRTGDAEVFDNGYSSPATGLEVNYSLSGETSATLTQGGTSATAFASNAIELILNTPPTVDLNTPNSPADGETGISLTPDLNFIGTDANADTIEYNIQVDTANTFDSVGGWTTLNETNNGTFDRVTVMWKRAVAGDVAPLITRPGGGGVWASIVNFRGAVATGNPFSVVGTPSANASSVTVTANGITPNAGDHVVFLATIGSTAPTYNVTNPILTSRYGGVFNFIGSGNSSGGATGVNTATFGGPAMSVGQLLSITPAGGGVIYQTNGTQATVGSGNFTPGLPVGWAVDDIFILVIHSADNVTSSPPGAPLLSKFSVTSDATFTDVTNGAHTHPFTSAEQVKYVVQAGDLSSSTLYYWRVKSTDPLGSATYGAWSDIHSFTTAAPPTVALNTPADGATGQSTTPTLNFTGTDPGTQNLEYNVQVDTANTFDSQAGGSPTTQVVTVTGSGSWQVPSGVTSVKVELWGGGGGAASGSAAGGSAGAYVIQSGLSVTPGNTITYVIATGGGGGTQNSSGGAAGAGYQSGGTGLNNTTVSGGGGGGSSSVVVGATTYIASGSGGSGLSGGSAATGSSGGNGGIGYTGYGGGGGGGSGTAGVNASGTTTAAGGTGGTTQTGTNGRDSGTGGYGGSSAGASGNGLNPTGSAGANGSGGAAGGGIGGNNGNPGTNSDSGGGGGYGTTTTPGGNGGQPGAGGGACASAKAGDGGAGKLIITYTLGTPLLSKFSSIPDAGFTAGHPFASGVAKDFTIQAGDALTPGTYYWRVSAIAPSGANQYGAWSSTRSFTVANTYTVTFDGNTNTGGATATQTLNYNTATALTSNGFTKTGSTFAGWATTAGGTVAYADGASYTIGAANVTLYAKWTTNTYTLTFDSAGGSAVSPISQDYGTAVTPPADPTRAGYTFTGWTPAIATTMPVDGQSLTAGWTANNNTITFNGNTSDGGSTAAQTIATDATASLTTNGFTKTGYTFAGWNTLANGTGTDYADGASYTMGTADVTLFAQWTINSYTLTFDSAGGSVVSPISQDYGTAVTPPADPTKTGYTFISWSPVVPATMPALSQTLTAQWTINQYSLTYSTGGNGIVSGVSSQTVTFGTDGTAVTAIPAEGYHFVNWTGTYTSTTNPKTDTTVTGDISVTANFEANPLSTSTLTYSANAGGTIVGTTPQTINYGANGTEVTATPNANYHFVSWSDAYPTAARTDTNITADITVSASFALDTHTVTFNKNGGDTEANPATISGISSGATVVTLPVSPTRTGYTFDSWNTLANGLGSTFTESTTVVADITVYAKWTTNSYTLTFNSADGSVVSAITQDYGTVVTAPSSPAKTGYTFSSWSPVVPANMPALSQTLTAQWTVNQYSIIFNSNGGSAVITITQNYGTVVTSPADPTRAGYTFTGWTPTIAGTMPVDGQSLTAGWTAQQQQPGGGGGYVAPATNVIFSGRAYPLSKVVLLKDGQTAVSTVAGPDSNFNISFTGLATGNYIFAIYGEDSQGVRSSLFTFPVYITTGAITKIGGIFIAPTIGLDKREVKRGDNIAIFGQSAQASEITIMINSAEEYFVKTLADKDGIYLHNFDTSPLEIGQHLAKSKAALSGEISPFSESVGFAVGTESVALPSAKCGKADLNCDGRVNLVDFSIAAYWYKRPISASFATIEKERLNGDGKVDLIDFSIMAYYWKG